MFYDDLPIWGFIGKLETVQKPNGPEKRYFLFTHGAWGGPCRTCWSLHACAPLWFGAPCCGNFWCEHRFGATAAACASDYHLDISRALTTLMPA